MFKIIEEWDRKAFSRINTDWAIPSLDGLFMALREPLVWVPLYAAVLLWAWWKMREQVWLFVVMTLITFAITDYGNSSILKPLLERPRPCHDPVLQATMRSLVECGGHNSMPSSHAANHFGLAMFWFSAVRAIRGRNWYWVWIWALAIGYAQVYVGKHYPLDIIAGAGVGVLVGWGTAALLRYAIKEDSLLQRIRYKLGLISDLPVIIRENNLLKGAELGAETGKNMRRCLEKNPELRMIGLDLWEALPGNNHEDNMKNEQRCRAALKKFKDRAQLYKGDAAAVADEVEDQSLDFIFYDIYNYKASSIEYHRRIIEKWLPKLKKGGYFIGRDFHNADIGWAIKTLGYELQAYIIKGQRSGKFSFFRK